MKYLKNNKGTVLPLVLFVLTLATIFGFTSLNTMSSQTKFNIIDDSTKKAMEYAEAGYNQYLWHLNDDVNFYSTTESTDMQNVDIPFMDGFYRLEVSKPSDTDRFITIKSTGFTKSNPEIKKTVEAKIRKKQFVHYVYVSNSDGTNIWWTTGDESHGPYHTNKDFRIEKKPVFYDTVSYSGKFYGKSNSNNAVELKTNEEKKKTTSYYNPDFKIKDPVLPEKVDTLEFPATNLQLKEWAQKDNMVFTGRTCIYLDGDTLKIRNKDSSVITTYSVSSIKNKVIYVDKDTGGGTGKFDIKSGNIFIFGTLKGTLTIAAANDIYITHADPTNWYDYDLNNDLKNQSNKPNQPPETYKWIDNSNKSYPEKGGIKYQNTTFTNSHKPSGKDYWIREASGKDMLGLIANNNIYILHYGWPKTPVSSDGGKAYWDFKWEWKNFGFLLWPDYRYGQTNFTYDVAPKDVTIHSAVFAVNGGFGFEDYNKGARRGDIVLWGNITQKMRLAVGTIGSTGYNKLYSHDPRMFYDYPPHILEPVNVGWEIHDWKETN